jgi:DNA-binding NarL/FixJ family response regulator
MVTELLKGRSNKEIAADFAIGEQSVKNMLSGIYAKLGVQSRTELFHAIFPL